MRLLSVRCLALLPTSAGLTFLASPAFAQQQPTELPGISVQGATLAAPRASASRSGEAGSAPSASGSTTAESDASGGVPAYTIGNAVTVITGEELRAQQIRQVSDALRSLPGVSVSRTGGFGSITQVRIRGGEGNHTLVLIDGVEANNPTDGELDFSNLSAEDIERIEVIRGPMSALYGSSAVGGVINIITNKGKGPLTLKVRSEIGTLNSSDVAAQLSGGNKWAHFSLGTHWRNTDGFNIAPVGSETDAFHLQNFNFRGGIKLTETLGIEVNARQSEKNAGRDGFGGPVNTLSTAIDDPSTLKDKVWMGGVQVQWDTLDKTLTHQFRLNHSNSVISDKDLSFGPPAFFTTNEGERTTYGYLATYRFDTPSLWAAKHTLSGLIEQETESFTPEGTIGDRIKREREMTSAAAEWRGAFAEQVFITAGARHDESSVFDGFTTWRLAGAWAIKPLGLRPHASAGTAVKFPALFEQFGKFPGPPTFFPNPNLQPETSTGWDVGVEFTVTKATTFDVTYFHADLENKISPSGLPGPNPTLINLPGTSTREGVEFTLRTRLLPGLTGSLAYTYLEAQESTGPQEVRRPRHAGRADLAYAFAGGRGSANIGVLYNGSQTDNVFLNDPANGGFPFPHGRLLLDDYWVVNAATSYKLQPGVEVFARVENLFDRRYQEIYGYEAPPITAFAGVKLTLGGPDGIGGSSKK
jgi:vitamin B12 transporter